jgi:very-short-patch-repair endonuclease
MLSLNASEEDGMARGETVDRDGLRMLATAQHHNVTQKQLREAGYTAAEIRGMRRRGDLREVEPTVFRSHLVGDSDWKADTAARTLAYNSHACGLSAAALFDVVAPPSEPDTVTHRGRNAAKEGLCRSSSHLVQADVTTVDGIPCTSAARTCLDIAEWYHPTLALQIVESMLVRGIVKRPELLERAEVLRRVRPHGAVVIRSMLATIHPEVERSRNEWEAELARVVVEFLGILPVLNHRIQLNGRTYEVDAALVDWRVAIEFDGLDPHGKRSVFDRDHVRRNDFAGSDWAYFALTAASLRNDPARAMRQVARRLRKRGASLPPEARLHDPRRDRPR